jgi:hypothetical protein
MAKGPPDPDSRDRSKESFLQSAKHNWHNHLCAEHDGTVASFESLKRVLEDIGDYESLFIRKRMNLWRAGKLATGAVGGAAIIGPAALLAAPSIAAALGATGVLGAAGTGTTISTLSGAVLTKASLAAIGGTMAGGTAIITASGAALGAATGGVVSNSYFGNVRGFSVKKHNEGRGPAVIFVNGFLTEKDDEPRDWKESLRGRFAEFPWYHVRWESKTLAAIGSIIFRDMSGTAARQFAARLAARAAKKAGGRLNPVGWAALALDLAGNPWHVAMVKASLTGALLAEILSRTKEQEFILMGHSLGARVIYYALSALATKEAPIVRHAYLLGGAVGATGEDDWTRAADAVSGAIHNCYSTNDQILGCLYRGASAMRSEPIGIREIASKSPKIKNHDCSDFVDGHNSWKAKLPEVLARIDSA